MPDASKVLELLLPLLMGTQNNIVVLEDSLAVSYKTLAI